MSRLFSPLRYPGGKNKLFKQTKKLIEINNLNDCTYIEPFAGGSGLALSLLFKGLVNNIVLNDIDRSIYAFWYSVLNYTDELCNLIESTPVTIEEWYEQKILQENKEDIPILDLGFSTFFLNRTNRSGILSGGVMGGKNQDGSYKIDCRFNKVDLVSRIRSISQKRNQIELYNMDAVDFIQNVISNAPVNSFIFLDPPYYKKGPGLYTNYYKHDDHKHLARIIQSSIRQPWIVTYDNVEPIKKFYDGYVQTEFDLTYSAQNKYVGKEIMIFSHQLVPIDL